MTKIEHAKGPLRPVGSNPTIPVKGLTHEVITKQGPDGGPWCAGMFYSKDDARLYLLALSAPHDCTDATCPGAVNKRKLEAFEGLLEALKLAHEALGEHRGCHQGTTANKIRAAIANAEWRTT